MKEHEGKAALAMRAGFTLIEILVAVAIIGIMGTAAIQGVMQYLDKAKLTAARDGVNTLRDAANNYNMLYNKFPSSLRDLIEPRGDDEPLVTNGESALYDPWNIEYRMVVKKRSVVVISAGPDKEFDTEDDIRTDKSAKKTSAL